MIRRQDFSAKNLVNDPSAKDRREYSQNIRRPGFSQKNPGAEGRAC